MVHIDLVFPHKNVDDLSVSLPHCIIQWQLVQIILLSRVYALRKQELHQAESLILILNGTCLEQGSLVEVFSVVSDRGHFETVCVDHVDDLFHLALG